MLLHLHAELLVGHAPFFVVLAAPVQVGAEQHAGLHGAALGGLGAVGQEGRDAVLILLVGIHGAVHGGTGGQAVPSAALTVGQPFLQAVQRPVEDAGQLSFQLLGQQDVLLFFRDALGEGHQPDAPPDAYIGAVDLGQVVGGFHQLNSAGTQIPCHTGSGR